MLDQHWLLRRGVAMITLRDVKALGTDAIIWDQGTGAASGFAAASCVAQRPDAERHAQATAHAVQKSLEEVVFWDVDFISQIPVV